MSIKLRNCKNVLLIIFTISSTALFAQTIYYENFEDGIGNWGVSNGLWEVGIPLVGPTSAHSGQNCAGTDLDANYPSYADTRLRSPYITLPNITEGGHIKLKYWDWHRMNVNSFAGNDQGWIEISVNGGTWQYIAGPIQEYSPVWTQGYIDLTTYADSTIRIAFHFISNHAWEDNGWYIDDVRIEGIITEVDENENIYPSEFSLNQNYPNPFNPVTTIKFSIPKDSKVTLDVYDILGAQVKELKNEDMKPGYYEVELNASALASGVYFYRIKAGDFVQTKKMILLK